MRKGIQILILLAVFLLMLAGCKSEEESTPTRVSTSSSVELSEHYDTMSELKQGATIIVEVEVLDNYMVVHGDMPFTISNVKVLTSFKGNFKKDDKIKVIETGGKYQGSGKNVAFGGINVMQPGEHLVLFVKAFVGPQVTDAYVPLGVWQGKFIIGKGSNGKVEQQAPEEYKLKDYWPVSLSKFIKQMDTASVYNKAS